jgi:adenylosuccinate synthase
VSVTALIGAQYGSEGKGAIAAAIAKDYDVHVRTGGPNAGHTIYHAGRAADVGQQGFEKRKWVMRSVPCGWVNPDAHLMIGPGGLIDVELLLEEVRALDEAGFDVGSRLRVDPKCAVIDPVRHRDFEGGVGGRAHELIGSTGEGVGPARMARIARGTFTGKGINPAWSHLKFASDYEEELGSGKIRLSNVPLILDAWIEQGAKVLLEGTQGSGLSLVHGPWPYVTSADTNAAQLMVDAGISPRDYSRTILVARTFPIRVAGNSGPLENETTWEEIGVEPETTTVTKKVRRVGKWDDKLVGRAFLLNRPAVLAITFADYWWPEIAGCKSLEEAMTKMGAEELKNAQRTLKEIAARFNTSISHVGTGPDSVIKMGLR